MPYDDELVARVRSVLSQRSFEEKNVMGGRAFMVDGSMCCSVGGEGLLVRVLPREREATLALPHVSPMLLGKRVMKGFVRVAPEAIRTPSSLRQWIERGLNAARASVTADS